MGKKKRKPRVKQAAETGSIKASGEKTPGPSSAPPPARRFVLPPACGPAPANSGFGI